MLAGGIEEATELRRRCAQEQCLGWEDAKLMINGRTLLQNSCPSSDDHRALKSLFVKTLGRKKSLSDDVGNARSLSMDHHDFESVKLHRRLDVKKKQTSGESHIVDEVVEICADSIVPCCSEAALHVRCHCVRSLSVVLGNAEIEENNNN